MPETIKDGSSGNIAKVDSAGRLWTNAKSNAAEEVASHNGNAYIFHGECHLAAATSGGLMYYKHTSQDKHLHITRLYFDAQTLSNDILIYQVKNPTTVSNGKDVSSTGIINKNFSSGQAINGTLKISEGSDDITYTGGTNYHAFVLSSKQSTQRNMLGTNVLKNNDEILWGWTTLGGGTSGNGVAATNTDIISLSMNFYIRPVE